MTFKIWVEIEDHDDEEILSAVEPMDVAVDFVSLSEAIGVAALMVEVGETASESTHSLENSELCPMCQKSDGVIGDSLDVIGNEVVQTCYCPCGASWEDTYRLVHRNVG